MFPGPNQLAFVSATTYIATSSSSVWRPTWPSRRRSSIGWWQAELSGWVHKVLRCLNRRAWGEDSGQPGRWTPPAADQAYATSPATVAATMLVPRRSPTRPDSMRFMT